jgi:inosine-uridine nucleoside N-ribohydrolase
VRRTRRALVLAAVAALVAAGCGGAPHARPREPAPVVVDTDMSSDDVLALLYLTGRRDVDLRAVAVSGTGLVRCPAGARNARAVLALAGRPGVPVGCGHADPLAGFNSFPPEWRDRADDLFGLRLPAPPAARPRGAVEVLHAALARAGRPVTLLSLAPLTDTAQLLRAHPGDRARLAAVVAMGGAVRVPGNIGPGHERAEYNVWVDPAAAREVLAGGVPVTLVPLDATNDVPATVFTAGTLRRHRAGAVARLAWRVMATTGMQGGGQYFWDPLAATAVVRPGVLRFERLRLAVDAAGRVFESPGGHTARVALGADRPAFEHQLLATLLRGARFADPPTRAAAALTCDGRRCAYAGPRRGPAGLVVFDTVNRGDRPLTFVLARLSEGRTAADLRRYARGHTEPPVWAALEASGQTPPHSRMTWLVRLTPGEKALLAVAQAPPAVWVVAPVRVTRAR